VRPAHFDERVRLSKRRNNGPARNGLEHADDECLVCEKHVAIGLCHMFP